MLSVFHFDFMLTNLTCTYIHNTWDIIETVVLLRVETKHWSNNIINNEVENSTYFMEMSEETN